MESILRPLSPVGAIAFYLNADGSFANEARRLCSGPKICSIQSGVPKGVWTERS